MFKTVDEKNKYKQKTVLATVNDDMSALPVGKEKSKQIAKIHGNRGNCLVDEKYFSFMHFLFIHFWIFQNESNYFKILCFLHNTVNSRFLHGGLTCIKLHDILRTFELGKSIITLPVPVDS